MTRIEIITKQINELSDDCHKARQEMIKDVKTYEDFYKMANSAEYRKSHFINLVEFNDFGFYYIEFKITFEDSYILKCIINKSNEVNFIG